MALSANPHLQFMQRAKLALESAGSDIGIETWNIRRLGTPQGHKTWEDGAYLFPIASTGAGYYENVNDKFFRRTVAAMKFVNATQNLEDLTTMNAVLQKFERVEEIFHNCHLGRAPASIRNLAADFPTAPWRYYTTEVEPGDAFLGPAFGLGYDACVCVLKTTFIRHREELPDFTGLGT